MNFEEWEPVYEAILADFGYDRAGDESARDVLASLLSGKTLAPAEMLSSAQSLPTKTIAIAGAGPSLSADIDVAREADVVFAASTAADTLRENGVTVDCMVTDLDKNPERAIALATRGVPVAVHAHGDNIDAIRRYVPRFDQQAVLPTTQAAPVDRVYNTGGFTDGDRAAFLADHLGGDELVFLGWDFDDPTVTAEKRQKLDWAKRLLYWLERRRGDRFAVLDGHRDGLDAVEPPR